MLRKSNFISKIILTLSITIITMRMRLINIVTIIIRDSTQYSATHHGNETHAVVKEGLLQDRDTPSTSHDVNRTT